MPTGRTTLRAHGALALLTATAVAAATAVAPTAYAVDLAEATPTVALTVDRPVVNVTAAPAVVGVSARVSLPVGVAGVTLRFGDAGTAGTLYRLSGTPASGTWAGVATVPAFTAHGPQTAYLTVRSTTGTISTVATGPAVTVSDAAPGLPTSVSFRAVDGALRAEWAPPAATGTSPVAAYDVSAVPAPGSDPAALAPQGAVLAADARAVTFDQVTAGTRYVVRIAARNAAGTGPAAVADAVTGAAGVTVPDGPTAVGAVPQPRALSVVWAAPGSDGGSAVTRYDVRAVPRTSGVATPPVVSVTTPGAVVAGLTNGVTYDVAVTAVNAVGTSLAGATSAAPRATPSAPVLGDTTPGDGSAVVRWSPPYSDGAAPVHAYTVTVSTGRVITLPATSRSVTVRNLVNGTGVSFRVAASNLAGTGASSTTPTVVPRKPGRLNVLAAPASTVVYGTASTVRASLTSTSGAALKGQRVHLLAQVRPSTTWRRVDEAWTDAYGKVTLSAVLPATSALRLHHPISSVAAPDVSVRGVLVAPRMTKSISSARIRIGQAVTVTGSVAPAHAAGTAVRLQRYVSGEWRSVAYGKMTTSTSYRVAWKPGAIGTYLVRVILPAHTDHTTGKTAKWYQAVDPENAADVARAILNDGGITLETTHDSGISDLATARQNILDVAAGRLARRSAYQNAPGGYTTLDMRLLRALRRMGELGTVTVSEIAGGSHSVGSTHYYGRGLDISWVNGRHVGPGSNYALAVDTCRAFGASRVFSPGYDPYGGHQNHVHCEWS